MSDSITQSAEYAHMVAEGLDPDAAWGVVWIDRAYKYLIQNGMEGSAAYAQATAVFTSNGFDIDAMEPEAIVFHVLGASAKAQQEYAALDPERPAASWALQRRSTDQRNPS